MKALVIATTILAMTLPAGARAPNSGADYFSHQQEKLLEHTGTSVRPRANPFYPAPEIVIRPKRAPWYQD
jgi:hypothetical protein